MDVSDIRDAPFSEVPPVYRFFFLTHFSPKHEYCRETQKGALLAKTEHVLVLFRCSFVVTLIHFSSCKDCEKYPIPRKVLKG